MDQLVLDELPADILDAVGCYLTGWDLFHLSHANKQFWMHFSHKSGVWKQRLPMVPQNGNLKVAYVKSQSILFEGLCLDERLRCGGGTDGSGGALVQNPLARNVFTEQFTESSAFAVDTWFSLLDGEDDGVLTGGVLFGGQSPLMRTCMWSNHRVAFIAVDSDCSLYCSMLDDVGTCVATNLDFGRWYHLAMSFDNGEQCVHLNGVLVSQIQGTLHHSWRELSQVQAHQNICGWHNFHGVVDAFRVWDRPLREEEIRALAHYQEGTLALSPWYSMQRDAQRLCDVHPTKLAFVPCTRPPERVMELQSTAQPERKMGNAFSRRWHSFRAYLARLPAAGELLLIGNKA